ncbi:MAG: hypothetical protein ACTSO9_02000 [Candidatus Helarchaeota archaeon]
MAWDTLFKEIIRKELEDFDAVPNVTVGKFLLEIDMVIKKPRTFKPPRTLELFVKYMKDINIIEFKSAHDRPLNTDINKLLGYVGLYCYNNKLDSNSLKNLAAWYIVSYRPRYFDSLQMEKLDEGLFQFKGFLFPTYIVIIDQLQTKVENIPLLLFSSRSKLESVLKFIVQNKSLHKYISVSYLLYPEVMKKLTTQEDFYTFEEIQKNIKYAVEELGIKNVIESVGINRVIESVGIDKVIESIGIDKVIESVGIDKIKDALKKFKSKSK